MSTLQVEIEQALAEYASAVEVEYSIRIARDSVPFVRELHDRREKALEERITAKHKLLGLIREALDG